MAINFCFSQGNKLSIQLSAPKTLSICGVNDSITIQIFNISNSNINSISSTINLPPGINYVPGTLKGSGVTESNLSNLNKPVFACPNLAVAKNFYFRIYVTANCQLLNYISNNNTPIINCNTTYSGNYDVGNSLPFSTNIPSILFSSITNQSYIGNVNTKFERKISIGNYGKGPIKTLTLKRINGSDLKSFFVKSGTTTYSGDTTITILNKNDFKLIGNLDTFFDQNEVIVITDSLTIKGCNKLNTNYELYWGCSSNNCALIKNSGSVSISSNSPNLVFFPTAAYPVCFNNKNHVQLLKLTNNGSMVSEKTKITIDQYYYYDLSKIDTSTIKIKTGWKGSWIKPKIDSVGYNYNLGNWSCLGSNPIGLFRLNIGKIAPKDTLYIQFENSTCLSNACNFNFYSNSWGFYSTYYDQCNNIKKTPFTWGKYYDYSVVTQSPFTPTDISNTEKKEFRHYYSSMSFYNYDNTLAFQFDIVLPKGLKHSKSVNDLFFENATLTSVLKPDSIGFRGDTVRAYFNKITFIPNLGELVYYLTADCSVSGASGVKTIKTIFRYSPSKSCNKREWFEYCANYNIKIHCNSSCAQGLRFLNFNVQRSNFGKPDNNNDGLPDNSGSINLSKVREERALFKDTIKAVYQAKILKPKSGTSWKHLYVETKVDYGYYLDVVSSKFEVYRTGKLRSSNCNNFRVKKSVSGYSAVFKFDLSIDSISSCLPTGYDYKANDSISFVVNYVVSKNMGLNSVPTIFSNEFYTSATANPTQAKDKFQCDSFSGQMVLAGFSYINYGPDQFVTNNCNNINFTQNYYMGIAAGNTYAGNNYFPFEYRNFSRLKEIKQKIPKGYQWKNASIYHAYTNGSGVGTYQFKDSLKATVKPGEVVYETSKYFTDSSKGKFILSDDAYHGVFYSYFQPTCEATPSVPEPVEYIFVFERKGTFGSGFDTLKSLSYTDYVTFNKPIVSIKPTIPINYAYKDTAEWDLQYTNSSSTFSTLNVWFAPDNSGSVKVVEIRDLTKDSALKQNNGIFSAGNINYNSTKKFRVKAIYNTCNKDSVIVYSGWNCDGIPSSLSAYKCSTERIPLYIEPQNTQIQTTITDSISNIELCTPNNYRLLLENNGQTNARNLKAIVNLPVGMKVVNGSVRVKYPLNSNWKSIANPINSSGTTYEWDLSQLISQLQNGIIGAIDTTKNKILISFKTQTDCNYSSGNFIIASAKANIKCGNSVLVFPSVSNPITIKGVSKPYFSLLKTEVDSIFPCLKPSKVKVKIIILGPGNTGIEDKYQVYLPPGLFYDSTLFSAVRNSPSVNNVLKRNFNGTNEIEFSLPKDVLAGDSILFEYGFNANNKAVNCGTIDLYNQASVKQEVTCVANNSTCKINVVTSNSLNKVPVFKGDLMIQKLKSSIDKMVNDSEYLTLNFQIKNQSFDVIKGNVTKFKILFDSNLSGSIDINDQIVGTISIDTTIKKNGVLNQTVQLKVKAGVSCALYIIADSSTCNCSFNSYKFPIPSLNNAGVDKYLCHNDNVKLGSNQINGYKYLWDNNFDLNSDTIAMPLFTADNSGNKMLVKRLILNTQRKYCRSNDTILVHVYPLPIIKKIQNDTQLCLNKTVKLNMKVSGGTGIIKSTYSSNLYLNDSNLLSPVCSPAKSINYIFNVKDSFGCKAVDSVKIIVNVLPKANFTYNSTCYGDSIDLYDSSYISSGTIKSINWKFKTTGTLDEKQWKIGIYPAYSGLVKLTVKSEFGCEDTISKNVITHVYPKADFSVKNHCFNDSSYFVQKSTITQGKIVKYEWQFGDANSSNIIQPVHFYQSPDTFDVQLIVESEYKCKDTSVKSMIVYPNPISQFTINNGCPGDSFKTVNSSQLTGDAIKNFEWYLNGSLQTNQLDYKNQLFSDTTYTLKLIVNSVHQCADTLSKVFEVYSQPKAMIKLDSVCYGIANSFAELSKIKNGNLQTREWKLSDNSIYSTSNFNHTFSTDGKYQVDYKVISNHGCSDSTIGISMLHSRIYPNFQVADVCLGDSSFFKDLSNKNHTSITKWQWDFGNSNSSSFQNNAVLYNKDTIYNVGLQITSSEFCQYDTIISTKIFPNPIISFIDNNQCKDNQFDFSADIKLNSGLIDTFYWDFNDGTFGDSMEQSHVFPGAGDYKVVLYANSDFGCKDTFEQLIQSFPPVIVDFSNDSACLGHEVTFTNLSMVPNAGIKSYNWNFGDGNQSTIENPTHTYSLDGLFNVDFKITTTYNCTYSKSGKAKVYPVPTSLFDMSSKSVDVVNPNIEFTDKSSNADSVWYNMGDNQFEYQRNFKHRYPDSGTFRIVQYTTNKFGCIDSSSKNINVYFIYTFYIPNAFTPNKDFINNMLEPNGIGLAKYETTVFNRWGQIIYNNKESEPWDGTYEGEVVPNDNYLVVFKVTDFAGKVYHYRALVSLVR